MKTKTSALIGPALDWAVTKCEVVASGVHPGYLSLENFKPNHDAGDFCYSTVWSQGGPIIERDGITVETFKGGLKWSAFKFDSGDCEIAAETPLIAAMRCYVASKLGDEVDVPEGLE